MYKTTIPTDNAFTCTHPIEFYRLKERKRVYYQDNISLRYGMTYYVYSEQEEGWYKRELRDVDPEQELSLDILLGYVKIVYSEDEQQEIKNMLKRDKLSYRQFLQRSVGEYKQSIIKGTKRNDDQWQTKQNRYTSLRNIGA